MQFWKKVFWCGFCYAWFSYFSCNKKEKVFFFAVILWKCVFHREIKPKLFFSHPLLFFLHHISFSHSSISTWHQWFSMCSQDGGDYIVYRLLYLMAFISGAIFLEKIELLLLSSRMLEASLNTAWHSSVKDLPLQYSITILEAVILCQHTHICLPLVRSSFFVAELPDWKE